MARKSKPRRVPVKRIWNKVGTVKLTSILRTPGSRWNPYGGSTRFFAFTRYSIHFLLLVMFIVTIQFTSVNWIEVAGSSSDSLSWPWKIVGGVLAAATGAVAIWLVEIAPQFNWVVRSDGNRDFFAGSLLISGVFCAALLLGLSPLSENVRTALLYLLVWSAQCLMVAVLPRLKYRWVFAVVVSGVVVLAVQTVQLGHSDSVAALFPLFLFFVVVSTEWTLEPYKEIARTEAAESALKAQEDRLRIAQQLHDSLGQSIAAMSLKTELLNKLLAKKSTTDPAIANEVTQLKGLIDKMSTQMRQVVHGHRTIDLDIEIDRAISLLQQADISVTVGNKVDQLEISDPSSREFLGWFVREVSTNILRHAEATHVSIAWSHTGVEIINDGASGLTAPLQGLATLRTRARKAGGVLTVRRRGDSFISILKFLD